MPHLTLADDALLTGTGQHLATLSDRTLLELTQADLAAAVTMPILIRSGSPTLKADAGDTSVMLGGGWGKAAWAALDDACSRLDQAASAHNRPLVYVRPALGHVLSDLPSCKRFIETCIIDRKMTWLSVVADPHACLTDAMRADAQAHIATHTAQAAAIADAIGGYSGILASTAPLDTSV